MGCKLWFKIKKAFLVVDDAHNLQNAYMSLNSDSISEISISKAIMEAKNFYPKGGGCC